MNHFNAGEDEYYYRSGTLVHFDEIDDIGNYTLPSNEIEINVCDKLRNREICSSGLFGIYLTLILNNSHYNLLIIRFT
jgi:hypothetical protein